MGVPHIQLPKSGLAAEYRIVARKPGSKKERVLADWFPNLITDSGLDSLATSGWKTYCHVGTGTLTPSTSDSSLQTPIASTAARSNVVNTNAGAPSYYSQSSVDYTFPVGAGTYTEVGVSNKAHTDGTQVLFSRALIVDGGGNPTSITVLADEYLVVTYRIRMYPPLGDSTGSIGIGSDSHNYTIRARRVDNFNFWGRALENAGVSFAFNSAGNYLGGTTYPSGLLSLTASSSPGALYDSSSSDFANIAYVPGNYEVLGTVRIPFGASNGAGYIRRLEWRKVDNGGTSYTWGWYQCEFVPDVSKDSNIQLTFTLGMGWTRYVAP